MKKLYTFKGKIGEETFDFGLQKPNRTQMEDVEIFYSAILSKYMSRGVQTRAAVDKYYADNCDGAMTKDDEKEVIKLRQKLLEKEDELLSNVGDKNKEKRIELYTEITELTEKIRNFNEYYSTIYDNTAEIKARNKAIDYCFLNFSIVDDKNLFQSDEEDDQKRMLEQFDEMEEKQSSDNGENWREVFDKLLFLFTLWYMGAAETEEDFDQYYSSNFGKDIEKEIEEAELKEEAKKENEEEKPKEEAKETEA